MAPTELEARASRPHSLERDRAAAGIVAAVWLTYGSFYFCRQNIAVAVPLMGPELRLGSDQIGWILGALKLAYAVGQLVNGQLAERLPPRLLLAIGMLGSAALNVLFGLGTGLYFLLFVWACNGYAQSLGWTPCVRVIAGWVPVGRRGRAMGIVGTGYLALGAATYAVSATAVEFLGWRGAFYLPAALLAGGSVVMLLFLREAPTRHASRVTRHSSPITHHPSLITHHSPLTTLLDTLSNPALWVLALSLFLLDACRYGFADWGVKHLVDVQDSRIGPAALKYAVLPLGGIAGAYLAGWASDRIFGSRRGPVICILLLCLGLLCLIYDPVARASLWATVLVLFLVGFTIFGPQVLLVGTAPADLARRARPASGYPERSEGAAAAAGFVNFLGYMGAFTGDLVTGTVLAHVGWQTTVLIWAAWAFAAAGAAAFLWRAKG